MRRHDAVERPGLQSVKSWKKFKPTVESVEQRLLLTTFTVSNTGDVIAPVGQPLTPGTLRTAILQANLDTDTTPTIINFDIVATGAVQTIQPTAVLPTIAKSMTVNGASEKGYGGTPLIVLNGALLAGTAGVDGLDVSAGSTTIRGLAINRFTGNGISLSVAGGNTITNCYLGISSTGLTAAGNGLDGILVQAGSNTNTIVSNLISGNTGNGIELNGVTGGSATTTTSGNVITGNRIGLNSNTNGVVPNSGAGIYVLSAPMTQIGGTTDAARNVITGNRNGLELYAGSDNSVVEGNYLGTSSSGAFAPGISGFNSPASGIVLSGISNLLIGGTDAGAGNVISGNSEFGIDSVGADGSTAITIQGNMIGTDNTGSFALANTLGGINISGEISSLIGGLTASTLNVISGNTGSGISTSGTTTGLNIQGNYIGTALDGTSQLGNGGAGIDVGSDGVTIGGLATGAGNIIAYNGASGVSNRSSVSFAGSGVDVTILSNSIFSNTPTGLELFAAPPAPTITSAVSMNTQSLITGSVVLTPGQYTLQFFSSPSLDPGGNVEGEVLIGTSTVSVGTGQGAGQRTVPFSITLPSGFLPGSYISATVTDPTEIGTLGATSPFSSAPIIGTGSGAGSVDPAITVTTDHSTIAAGQNVTYTFTIYNGGIVPYSGLNFTDPIPSGGIFVTGSTFFPNRGTDGPAVIATNGSANDFIGTLGSGESVVVTIVLQAGDLGGSTAQFTNTATVTSTVPTVPANSTSAPDSASATVTVTALDDLAVSVVGSPNPVAVSDNVTFNVTVTNNGPSSATGVTLTDLIPTGTTFVSATTSQGTYTQSGSTLTAAIGDLAPGAVANLTIVVSTNPSTPTSLTNSASVTGQQTDGDATNNSTPSSTNPQTPVVIIPSADLGFVSETVSNPNVLSGQNTTFTLVLRNSGPSAATSVTVVDTLPSGLMFVSGTTPGGEVSFNNGQIIAPVGTVPSGGQVTVTFTVMTMMAGTFTDSAVVSATEMDPNPANNTSSATVTATALSDLSVAFQPTTVAAAVGDDIFYTAIITNAGPSPASSVEFTSPLPAGFTFRLGQGYFTNRSGSDTPDGLVQLVDGNIVATGIYLPAGDSESISFTLRATQVGTFTETANVTLNEPDPNPANNTAVVTTTVTLPSPVIGFNMAVTAVNENAGTATILINRVGNTATEVGVHFSTVAGGNATAGVDYQPVSTTVTFPVGVSQVAITVPVLVNTADRLDEVVNLQLDTPTGGAVLAGGATTATATLRIVNINADTVGPKVTDLKLFGPLNSITAIEIDTDGGLDPTTAGLLANYTIIAMGGTGAGALPIGTVVPVSIASYNPTTGAILVFPSVPLPSNELFVVLVNGTTGTPITDRAGNPLNSVLGSVAGSNYVLTVGRGNNLLFTDENGTQVNLRLSGPGTLDINRAATGQIGRLQILGATNKTTISGSVSPSTRRTNIGVILGFSQFGRIKSRLLTPPFYVANRAFPNAFSLNGPAAVDTLIGANTGPTTTKKTRTTVKSRAITTTAAKHPSAALAHASHVRKTR